jgi:hypothetical protein
MNIITKITNSLNRVKIAFLIIGSLLWGGSIYLIFVSNIFAKDDPALSYLIEISGALFCGLIITLTWDVIIDAFGTIKNEELLREFIKSNKGFRLLEVELSFTLATKYIANCENIRAIGTAQQDHKNPKIKEAIARYLTATTNRLNSQKRQVKYRRISNISLNDEFQGHVREVLAANNVRFHDIEMIFYNHFTPFYTYLIIDDKFMMLSINHPPKSDSYCEYCLVCENKQVIDLFTTQFIKIFEKERDVRRAVKDIVDFEKSQTFDRIIYSGLENILSGIDIIPNMNEHYKRYIIPELSQMQKSIKGLSDQKLEINHTISNGNLLSVFCQYMDGLSKNDVYTTITFFEFWYDIVNKGKREPDFIESNIKALKNGAIISRLLVIDENIIKAYMNKRQFNREEVVADMKELTYFFGIQKVIKLNLKIAREFPENYSFRILISKNHKELRQDFFNFAILKINGLENEKILFQPSNTAQIESTTILFYSDLMPDKHQRQFDKKEKQLKEITEMWKNQDCSMFADFFKNIDSEFFMNHENQIACFGRKLKN